MPKRDSASRAAPADGKRPFVADGDDAAAHISRKKPRSASLAHPPTNEHALAKPAPIEERSGEPLRLSKESSDKERHPKPVERSGEAAARASAPSKRVLASPDDVEADNYEKEHIDGAEETAAADEAIAAAARSESAKRARPRDAHAHTHTHAHKAPRSYKRETAWTFGETPEALSTSIHACLRASSVGRDLTDLELGPPLPSHTHVHIPRDHVPTRGTATSDVGDIVAVVKHCVPDHAVVLRHARTDATALPRASPRVIIVCVSARRCADMLRPLAAFHVRIAKLFARHLSVEECVANLQGPPVHMAVGTPHRIRTLIADGHLRVEQCRVVIADVHPDPKGFTLFTQPQCAADWWQLYFSELYPRIAAGSTMKLALY